MIHLTVFMVVFPPRALFDCALIECPGRAGGLIQINPRRILGVAYGPYENRDSVRTARYNATSNQYEATLGAAKGLDTDFSSVDLACRI
jgi:hypothetical protein